MTTTSNKTSARLFGVFFILSFLCYGIGQGLIEAIIDGPKGLEGIHAQASQLILGALMMGLLHTIANIGLGIMLFPVLKSHDQPLAYGYGAAVLVSTIMLMLGSLFLFLLIPLSKISVRSTLNRETLETLYLLCQKVNFYAYQMGMAIWGLGGLMCCLVLYRSQLIPSALTLFGFVGYILFATGTILELFGYPWGLLLSIPGGVFELSLSLWLIIKGFSTRTPISNRTSTLGGLG